LTFGSARKGGDAQRSAEQLQAEHDAHVNAALAGLAARQELLRWRIEHFSGG